MFEVDPVLTEYIRCAQFLLHRLCYSWWRSQNKRLGAHDADMAWLHEDKKCVHRITLEAITTIVACCSLGLRRRLLGTIGLVTLPLAHHAARMHDDMGYDAHVLMY